jgi:amidase
MVAIGTETNGSIVCPSNNNGIVGIKPTVGLISRSGIIPIAFTQDTPGPMARTVEDAAICLGVLTGIDTADSKTLSSKDKYHSGYSEYLNSDGLTGKLIGVYKKATGYSDPVDTLFNQAVRLMKLKGARVIEITDDMGNGYGEASYEVLLYEFKDGVNKYLARLGERGSIKSLRDLIEFNKSDTIELKYFNQEILVAAEKKGDLSSPEYKKSLEKMLIATREEGIDKIMNNNNLDALIAPTGSPAWKTDLLLGDHFGGSSSSPAAISGYPAITVPMGFISGLPVGISFFGRAWSEPLLIEIAYSYEQASKNRKAPAFIATN